MTTPSATVIASYVLWRMSAWILVYAFLVDFSVRRLMELRAGVEEPWTTDHGVLLFVIVVCGIAAVWNFVHLVLTGSRGLGAIVVRDGQLVVQATRRWTLPLGEIAQVEFEWEDPRERRGCGRVLFHSRDDDSFALSVEVLDVKPDVLRERLAGLGLEIVDTTGLEPRRRWWRPGRRAR